MRRGKPDRGRGRGGGHGHRAKGVTLREHRTRKPTHRPTPLFSDLEDDQDETRPNFVRRELQPGPIRSLAIDDNGETAISANTIALREQTRRLLTEIPEEWDGLVQQTFDHIASDQALLADSLQALFAIDLNELADSLESLPSHVFLRLDSEYCKIYNSFDDEAIFDPDIPTPEVPADTPVFPSSQKQSLPISCHSPRAPSPSRQESDHLSPARQESDQVLHDLLELSNQDTTAMHVAAHGDSDSEIDRLLDEL